MDANGHNQEGAISAGRIPAPRRFTLPVRGFLMIVGAMASFLVAPMPAAETGASAAEVKRITDRYAMTRSRIRAARRIAGRL